MKVWATSRRGATRRQHAVALACVRPLSAQLSVGPLPCPPLSFAPLPVALGLAALLLTAACADKYELEPYQMAPGDRIDSDRRAKSGTFHFRADGGVMDGGGRGQNDDGDGAWQGDASARPGATDALAGQSDQGAHASPNDGSELDGATDGAAADGDAADADDGGDGALPDLLLCSHGSCATEADCGVDLVGVGSCSLALCVDGCCELATAPPGSNCDDGDACTVGDQCQIGGCVGTATVCDDGLACTSDQCEPQGGTCVHTIDAGHCKIDGVCIPATETAPGLACLWCDPKFAATDWSTKPDCCASDVVCPHGGVCEQAKCDLATGKCSLEKKIGCCTDNSQCDDNNACTIDTCDLATGNCSIVAKVCADPTACQAGVCDPNSGQCVDVLKPGYCAIGFQCISAGAKAPGQPCASCQPKSKTDGYTVDVGALCDDGDSCTEADTCQADGACTGKVQTGCCKSDQDCQPPPGPCVVRTCDVKAGVCISENKAGCCDKGVCCDLKSNTLMAAGSQCAAVVIASEYKCDGQAIVKRTSSPGCVGQDAQGCSSDPAHLVVSQWQKIDTCAANTKCTAAGSGVKPTCAPTGPVGSCTGACGGKTKTAGGTCYCDAFCTKLGDCCGDFAKLCGCDSGVCCDVDKKFPKAKGLACGVAVKTEFQCLGTQLQKRTAQGSCDGVSAGCSTASAALKWSAWLTQQTCAAGTTCTITGGGASGSCAPKPGGSCVGKCGGQSSGCWCDNDCVKFGDCCNDFIGVCSCGANPASTCKGGCGGKGVGGCWCDALCADFGDCCADKPNCCS